MLINKKSAGLLRERLKTSGKTGKVFCSGLFLSARWFVFSSVAESGMHLIVLPDKDSAEYCASDLYYLTDGDRVFFLPDTGKKIERSNYKASLEVQRTSALEKIMKSGNSGELAVIVTYPAALEEKIPEVSEIRKAVISIRKGDDVKHEVLCERLSESGFSRVDFVSEPGQYAVRGGLIDIFSYSFNNPFRISFFGSEVESISVFNCNTQLSENTVDYVDIYPELAGSESEDGRPVTDLFGDDTVVWLDSSDMYMNSGFFPELNRFRQVYIDTPLSLGLQDEDIVKFDIAPQPVFNKNFELLTADIRLASGTGEEPVQHSVTLGRIVELLEEFRDTRRTLGVPDVGDAFTRKLHATYLSYLSEDGFGYPVVTHSDERGSFTELLRTADRGQVSVNITRPHVTKGNHWHHSKNEKFIVVSGRGVIRFRDVRDPEAKVIEYPVSGDRIEVIDVPTGYTHNFENLGDTDMVTFIWCNECFDPQRPDTYSDPV